jgi:hypothetical protein
MSERRIVYQDAFGVRRTLIVDDDNPDRFVVQTAQDVEPILAGVVRDRETMRHNGVNKLLARAPVHVYERSILERWDDGDWTRWLNSEEARPFRVWEGEA